MDRLLEDAHGGVSGALVVRGEAGIGKSALLGYAVRRATPGMLVLRAEGVEAEADLAFAGLYGLLRDRRTPRRGPLGRRPGSRPVKGGTKQASITSPGQVTSPTDPGDAVNPDPA